MNKLENTHVFLGASVVLTVALLALVLPWVRAWRGYDAYGGEWALAFLPVAGAALDDWRNSR